MIIIYLSSMNQTSTYVRTYVCTYVRMYVSCIFSAKMTSVCGLIFGSVVTVCTCQRFPDKENLGHSL